MSYRIWDSIFNERFKKYSSIGKWTQKLPLYSIQNWLQMYRTVLQNTAHKVEKYALQGVQAITSYFPEKW